MSFTSTDEYTRRFKNATAFQMIKAGGAYSVVPANPAANRQLNIIDPGGTDDFLFKSASQIISNKTLGTDLAAGGFKITGLADGTASDHAVTLGQLQASNAGLSVKESVRVATTTNVATLAGGAPNTVDGVSLALNDRILVKNQSTGSQNGLYKVTTVGTGSNGTWARTTDFDGAGDVPSAGTVFVFVSEGSVAADTGWVLTTNAPYTIGSTSLAWTQFSSATTLTAGNGISISSGIISVVGTTNRISVGVGGVDISTSYAGQASIDTLGTVTTGTWSATTIALNKGGTGQTTKAAAFDALSPMTTLGDTIAGGASGTGTRVAGNTTTTKKFYNQTGDGTNSAAPTWSALASGDIPVIALGTVGSAGGISGTLGIGNGGTGQTTAPAALAALGGMPFKLPVAAKTADYTLVAGTDIVVLFTTSNTDRVPTLPTAGSGTKGQLFIVQKVDSGTGKLTVTPTGCNINGVSTWPIDVQWDGIWCIDDGNNYIII